MSACLVVGHISLMFIHVFSHDGGKQWPSLHSVHGAEHLVQLLKPLVHPGLTISYASSSYVISLSGLHWECRASRMTQSCSSFPTQLSHPGTSAGVMSLPWLTSSSSHCSSSRIRCALLQTAPNIVTSMLIQKRVHYTGNFNREMSEDSKNTFLHCGDGLESPTSLLLLHTTYICASKPGCLLLFLPVPLAALPSQAAA